MGIDSFGIGIKIQWTPGDINQQLEQIQNHINSQKLNVKVNLDNVDTSAIQKVINSSNVKVKILDETEIARYQQHMENMLQNLRSKYGNLLNTSEIQSQINSFKTALGGLGQNGLGIKDLNLQFETLESNVKASSSALHMAQHDAMSLGDAFKQAFEKFPIWMITATVYMQMVYAFREGISTVIDLNSAITTIHMTMDMTNDDMTKLTSTSQQMAKQMGISISEVLNAVKVYANEQENVNSILEKTQADIMLATASGMDTTKTTDAIQAVMQQFELTATGTATRIADTLEKVSANMPMDFQRGIQQIVDGIKVSGTVAKEAGFDLERYESVLGNIIAQTRLGGSQVGNALKTIGARLGRVKDPTEATDEDVSQAEAAYKTIGINIRDQITGEFKDLPTIFDQLSAKWQNLTNVQRSFIAEVSAGVRQKNIFEAMLNGWANSTDLYTKALDSSGFALERQQIYLDSTKAKIEQFKATLDTMWQTTMNSSSLNAIISGVTGIAGAFSEVSHTVGLLPTLLTIAMTGFNLFGKFDFTKGIIKSLQNYQLQLSLLKMEQTALSTQNEGMQVAGSQLGLMFQALTGKTIAQTAASVGLTLASTALNAALTLGLSVGISAIVSGIGYLINSTQRQKEEFNSLTQSVQQLKQETTQIPSLINQYELLSSQTVQTADSKQQLADVTQKLTSLFPEVIAGYNSEGKAILGNIELVKQLAQAKEDELKTKQQQLSDQFKTSGDTSFSQLQNDQQKLNDLLQQRKSILEQINNIRSDKEEQFSTYGDFPVDNLDVANKQLNSLDSQISTLQSKIQQQRTDLLNMSNAFVQAGDSASKLDKDTLSQFIYSLSQSKDKISDFYDKLDALGKSDFSSKLEEMKQAFDGLAKIDLAKAQDYYLKTIVPQLLKSMSDVGINGTAAKEVLDKMFVLPNAEQAKDKIQAVAMTTKDYTDALKTIKTTVQDVSKAMDEYNQTGKFSASTIIDLVEKYPSLLDQLQLQHGQVTLNSQAVKSLADVEVNSFVTRLEAEKNFTSAQATEVQARINNLVKEAQAYSQAVDAQQTAMFNMMKSFGSMDNWVFGGVNPYTAEANKLQSQLSEDAGIDDKIAAIKALAGQVSSETKSSTTSSSKAQNDLTDAIIRAADAQSNLTKLKNDTITKQLDEAKKQKDYNLELLKTQELLSGQKQQVADLQNANQQLANLATQISSRGKFNTSDWFDQNGEVSLQYQEKFNSANAKTQKLMDQEFQQLQKINKAIQSNTQEIQTQNDAYNTTLGSLNTLAQDLSTQVLNAEKSIQQAQLDTAQNALTAFKTSHQTIIDGLQAQLDAMKDNANAEQEEIDRQQKLLDITNAQNALNNALNEKNVRVYTAGQGWVWSSNPNDVAKAQQDLQTAQTNYNTWEQQTQEKHQEQALQSQIDYQNQLIKNQEKTYNQMKDAFDNQWKNIGDLSTKLLAQYGNNIDQAVAMLSSKLTSLNAQLAGLTGANGAVLPSDLLSGGKPTVTASGVDAEILKKQYGDSISIVSGTGLAGQPGTNRIDTNQMYQSLLSSMGIKPTTNVSSSQMWGFAGGGVNSEVGPAMLHGTQSSAETIFNATDGKKLWDWVHNLPNAMSSMMMNFRTPSFTVNPVLAGIGGNGGGNNGVTINNMTVVTPNVDDFKSQMQNLARMTKRQNF